MKKIVFILGILLPMFSYSQLTPGGSVVYDPTQAANMSTQISNSATQIKQLEKSLEYMKKASEQLDKVNSSVMALEDLGKIVEMQKEAIKSAHKARIYVERTKDATGLKVITKSLNNISSSIKMINNILKNGFFKLTDKERIDLIRNERMRVHGNLVKIKSYAVRI